MKKLFVLTILGILAICCDPIHAQAPSSFPYSKPVTNDPAVGTTQFTLTKINASGNAVIMATTDTNGYTGICVSNCGTTGTAWIAFAGYVPLKVDGTTTVQHYIKISPNVGGDGADTGASTYPFGVGSVIGRVQIASTGAGSFSVIDLNPETLSPGSGTCSMTIGSDNGPALLTADIQPQKSLCPTGPLNSGTTTVTHTVTAVVVLVDSGASTLQLFYRHNGSTTAVSPLLTPATVSGITDKVACANAGGTAITIEGNSVTCSTLTNTVLTSGDEFEIGGGTADGITKRISLQVSFQ